MANTYDIGDEVYVQGTFTNAAGTAIDPTTVKCTYEDPSGVSVTKVYGVDAVLTKSSTGVYRCLIYLDEAGRWYYAFDSYTTGIAASEGYFAVRERNTTRPA